MRKEFNTIKFEHKDFKFNFTLDFDDLYIRKKNFIFLRIIFDESNPNWIFGSPFFSKYTFMSQMIISERHSIRSIILIRMETTQMIPMKQLLPLTGYVRGGCSPLGMKKQFPTFIDETGILFDEIAVSAGERGEQIIVNAEELAQVVGATLADLCM